MKIFEVKDLAQADQITIKNEGITSADLNGKGIHGCFQGDPQAT
jgi:hypothetical protein